MIRYLRAISLIAGPLLLAVATFFWEDTRHGTTASVIGFISTAAGIYGILGLWERLIAWRPWFGVIGMVLAITGYAGGMSFTLQGFFEGIFDVSKSDSLDAAAAHPVAAQLVLWLPGPAMPASLAALGIALAWSRLAPLWVSLLLMASSVVFPLSRIARIEPVAHAADLLILTAYTALAVLVLRGRLHPPGVSPVTATRLQSPEPIR